MGGEETMPTDRENEALIQAGLNLIQQALSIYDRDLRLAACNRAFREMFGLPDRLVTPGATFEDTCASSPRTANTARSSDLDAFVRDRVETARAFQPHYMERTRANGRTISVEGAPLPQGGWVTVYTDITAIRRQEELLRSRSEELSEKVLANAEELSRANRELAATIAALEEAKRQLTEMESRTRLTTEMMPAHIAHLDAGGAYVFTNRRLSSLMPSAPATCSAAGSPRCWARASPRSNPRSAAPMAARATWSNSPTTSPPAASAWPSRPTARAASTS
jgi:hypothetical protein